jgi:hypothetical protein
MNTRELVSFLMGAMFALANRLIIPSTVCVWSDRYHHPISLHQQTAANLAVIFRVCYEKY